MMARNKLTIVSNIVGNHISNRALSNQPIIMVKQNDILDNILLNQKHRVILSNFINIQDVAK